MDKETAKCSCGNINEIKISTGHNKPENKGKKYFNCSACNKFQWFKEDAKQSESREPVNGDVNSWIPIKEKQNESMMRMSALKAASEVVAAYITRPDSEVPKNITELLLQISDRTLNWLKGIDLASSTLQTDEGSGQTPSASKEEEDLF